MNSMARWLRCSRSPKGFTLIELSTVVSIVGVLATIGMPGLIGGIQRTGADGASRQLTEDIRLTHHTSFSRGYPTRIIIFNSSGVAQNPTGADLTDTTKANMYRVEMRAGSSWPALSQTRSTTADVLTDWNNLPSNFRGVTVTTGRVIAFNPQGFLADSAASLDATVQGVGGTKTVRTSVIGKATIQ